MLPETPHLTLPHKRHLPTPLLNVARRSASAAASQVTVPAPADESRTAQGSGAEAAGTPSFLPTAHAPAPASSAPSPLEHIGPVQPSPWTCGELAALQAGGDRSLAFGSVAVGFSSMQLASFLCPCVRFATFGDVLSRLPAAARVSICSLLDTPGGLQGSALHCYVDGSYTLASVDAPALLGWACVFILPEPIRISIVAWQFFQSDLTLQLGVFPPLLPSVVALTAALWIGGTVHRGCEVTYLSDCSSAIGIAQGIFCGPTEGPATVLRRIASCMRATQPRAPSIAHVPGHRGIFGNELC